GKVARDMVQVDRTGVIEFDSHPSRSVRPQSIGPGMEEGRDLEFRDLLIQWIEPAVVWVERLYAGMELCSLQAEILDRAFDLIDCPSALPWIYAGKPDEVLRIGLNDLRNLSICQGREAARGFGIPGQQDADDIPIGILPGDFLHFADGHFVAKELLGGGEKGFDRSVQEGFGREMNVHVDGFRH